MSYPVRQSLKLETPERLEAYNADFSTGDVAEVSSLRATFTFDSTSTQTVDNVNVIASSTSAGRWVRNPEYVPTSIANVKDPEYGAVGDGVTNDRDAIQRALDTGKEVYFPAGVYYLGTSPPLLYYPSQTIGGPARAYWGTGGVTLLRYGGQAIFAPSSTVHMRDVTFHDMTIVNGNTLPAGSIGISLLGVSHSSVLRCSFRGHETAILCQGGPDGGYYNTIDTCEVASCGYGVKCISSANSTRIKGGRIVGTGTAGIYVKDTAGVFINTTLESNNGVAIHFDTNAGACTVVDCYFEGNLQGAVVCEADATHNYISRGNLFSNSSDYVIDRDGRNFAFGMESSLPCAKTGIAGGRNMIANSSFESDQNGDGVADGWDYIPLAGVTPSLDSTHVVEGTLSQKIAIGPGNPGAGLLLSRTLAVDTKRYYTVLLSTYADAPTGLRVRMTNTVAPQYNSGRLGTAGSGGTGEFCISRFQFKPTASTVTIEIYLDTADQGNVWIDQLQVLVGLLPLEPPSDGILEHIETFGPPVASASSISITHPIHRISGTTEIKNILPPAGFAGTLTLIADTGVKLGSSGVGAGRILSTAQIPSGGSIALAYDVSTSAWAPAFCQGSPPDLLAIYGSNLKGWFESTSGVAADGGLVTRWSCKAGRSADLTAAGAARPLFVPGSLGIRPAIVGDGVASVLTGPTTASLISLSEYTIFTIAKMVAAPSAAAGAASANKNAIYCDSSAYVGLVADSTPELVGFSYDASYRNTPSPLAVGSFQRTEHNHTLLERVHRTRFTLQAFRRGIAVDRHNQAIAQLARIRQIRNVASVQNVEHAVGHHHFFTTLARGGDGYLQLVFGHDAKTGICTTAHRVFQLDWRNG